MDFDIKRHVPDLSIKTSAYVDEKLGRSINRIKSASNRADNKDKDGSVPPAMLAAALRTYMKKNRKKARKYAHAIEKADRRKNGKKVVPTRDGIYSIKDGVTTVSSHTRTAGQVGSIMASATVAGAGEKGDTLAITTTMRATRAGTFVVKKGSKAVYHVGRNVRAEVTGKRVKQSKIAQRLTKVGNGEGAGIKGTKSLSQTNEENVKRATGWAIGQVLHGVQMAIKFAALIGKKVAMFAAKIVIKFIVKIATKIASMLSISLTAVLGAFALVVAAIVIVVALLNYLDAQDLKARSQFVPGGSIHSILSKQFQAETKEEVETYKKTYGTDLRIKLDGLNDAFLPTTNNITELAFSLWKTSGGMLTMQAQLLAFAERASIDGSIEICEEMIKNQHIPLDKEFAQLYMALFREFNSVSYDLQTSYAEDDTQRENPLYTLNVTCHTAELDDMTKDRMVSLGQSYVPGLLESDASTLEISNEDMEAYFTKMRNTVSIIATSGEVAYPLVGTYPVSSEFDPGRRVLAGGTEIIGHWGIDLACPAGTSVVAAVDGTVQFAGWQEEGGNYVTIVGDAGGSTYTFAYYHLSNYLVNNGQEVKKGQIIAYAGNSGAWTTGAHLHFEIRKGAGYGEALNPRWMVAFP